jgi:tRNA A58 N-methylase Trm61
VVRDRWHYLACLAGFVIPLVLPVRSETLALRSGVSASGQLGSRDTRDWITRLERPSRVAGLKIDEVISKLRLAPGQVVADIGAGPGVFSVPFARAVSPGGKVYAVEIDQIFLDHIAQKVKDQQITNVVTVLGQPSDPNLPARDVDLAFFHDVLHHIEDRAGYLKSLARYFKPSGRIALIDGGQEKNPELHFTKEQAKAWMADAGFEPVEEFNLYQNEWFVVYAKR